MAAGRWALGLEAGRLAGAEAGAEAGRLAGAEAGAEAAPLAGAAPYVRTMGQPRRSRLSRSGAISSGQPKFCPRNRIPSQ